MPAEAPDAPPPTGADVDGSGHDIARTVELLVKSITAASAADVAEAEESKARCGVRGGDADKGDSCNGGKYRYVSGVIPFTISSNNSVLFLLGKARSNHRLSSFSGKDEAGDLSSAATAAREFYEETLGAIMTREEMLLKTESASLMLTSTTPRGMPCFTYIVYIPYRRSYAYTFTRTRRCLLDMDINEHALHEMTHRATREGSEGEGVPTCTRVCWGMKGERFKRFEQSSFFERSE